MDEERNEQILEAAERILYHLDEIKVQLKRFGWRLMADLSLAAAGVEEIKRLVQTRE